VSFVSPSAHLSIQSASPSAHPSIQFPSPSAHPCISSTSPSAHSSNTGVYQLLQIHHAHRPIHFHRTHYTTRPTHHHRDNCAMGPWSTGPTKTGYYVPRLSRLGRSLTLNGLPIFCPTSHKRRYILSFLLGTIQNQVPQLKQGCPTLHACVSPSV
jgi:hypothetical protein